MFRYYYTNDLISELEKELLRDHSIVQLMIDEYDLFLVSKSLFEAIEEGISIEIVVISTSNKKSMKLVNLCKRLIDLNVQIYWRIDKNLFVKEDYFGIFDKEYLISKREQPNFDDAEGLIRFKNDFFNGLALDSRKLSMFDGDIQIQFESNRSIIYPKEEIELSWEVLNAHEVQIEPLDKKFESKGVQNILIDEDTKFTLTAKNKGNIQKKTVFVRVLKIKEIHFDIEVLDPVINEYITINSSSIEDERYAVYLGQKVKISWNIKMIGKLIESKLGNLPLSGFHEFEIFKDTEFNFIFKSLKSTQRKNISLHCFKDSSLFREIETEDIIKKTKKKSFTENFLYLVKDFFSRVFE
ncbi:MAG: hypothetical protein CMB82_03965 [Flammeovirgaceae bacterium]|nr:hypothetical protein [Flammeovirgaceae bacterium]